MNTLNRKLGQSMSTSDVAEYLNIDVKTVRKYYRNLGGIRIGRRYVFFEEEVCNAIQKNRTEEQQKENCLDRTSQKRRQKEGEAIQNEERGRGMGSEDERSIKRRLAKKDKHGLFG